MFRIIYGKVYSDEKEANKAAAAVKELGPSVQFGKGSYVVEIGRYKTRREADSAYAHYRAQGLRVFIQRLEGR